MLKEVAQVPVEVVSNPEFLKEGTAIDDFMRPDRVVVGVASEGARKVMAELYAPFVRTEQPILFMDRRSAELAKYAANAMLATRVSFMNDVAALCDRLGCDVDQVRRGLGSDKRIGHSFLFPGIGFGGSCFPKDVRAMMSMGRQEGLDFDLLRAVERVNERQKRLLFDKAVKHFGSLAGKRFGVWGLAFKPKTDDMREAPALTLIQLLTGAGAEVTAHDPVAAEPARKLLGPHVKLAPEPYGAAEGADALFLVTEWSAFRSPDWTRLARAHALARALRRPQRVGRGQGTLGRLHLPRGGAGRRLARRRLDPAAHPSTPPLDPPFLVQEPGLGEQRLHLGPVALHVGPQLEERLQHLAPHPRVVHVAQEELHQRGARRPR